MNLETWRSFAHPLRAGGRRRTSSIKYILLLAALSATASLACSSALAQDEAIQSAEAAFYGGAGTGHQQGPFVGTVPINNFVGADRFYAAGYTGSRSVMANIEAGYVWNAHESLAHVQKIPTVGGALGENDRHATWVGFVMGGRPTVPGNLYQTGMAPDAQLFTGAIALNWAPAASPNPPRFSGSFSANFFGNSTFSPYRSAFQNGLAAIGGTRTADVINSSYNTASTGSLTGMDTLSGVIDALANANSRTLMTAAAGNSVPSGEGPNRVLAPATAYNVLSVGALGTLGTGYDSPSFFTNGGPNDYSDPTLNGGTISQVRQVVDISAPGESYAAAYYGGESGGNRPSLGGSPDGPTGGPDYYTRSVRGTSFSAPTVAGGAALLYDAAYDIFGTNADARDARVMKSVLMNSADKTTGWNNGQVAHANGLGGIFTDQGLDNRVGTGRLNLDAAFDQFLSGTTDVAGTAHGSQGNVQALGWDFGEVAQSTTNDYFINRDLLGGSLFTATLSWFRDRVQVGSTSYTDDSYDNLDLELWEVAGGVATNVISASASVYNNSEHFQFEIPQTGLYALKVRWSGELFDLVGDINSELYGLSWAGTSVPEPAAWILAILALAAGWLGLSPRSPSAA